MVIFYVIKSAEGNLEPNFLKLLEETDSSKAGSVLMSVLSVTSLNAYIQDVFQVCDKLRVY